MALYVKLFTEQVPEHFQGKPICFQSNKEVQL